MTNADKFRNVFGLYATELWSMPEKDFLKWLNSEAMNCSKFPNSSDLISRQVAISLAGDLQIHSDEYHMHNQAINNYCAEIIKLPSAQHEIIHCKDCAYYGWDCVDMPYGMTGMIRWCNKFYTSENENIEVEPNDFCKWAERKVDE